MLSVIVVSYNTREITLKCLSNLEESLGQLKKTLKISSEVIVVDNASGDRSAEEIRKQFPNVKILQLDKNTGFAHGNNLGMKKAAGEWLLLLNSDAFVDKETLTSEFEFIRHHPQADMVGCKLLNKDRTLQPSFGYFPTLTRLFYLMFFIDSLPVVKNQIKSIHDRIPENYLYAHEVDWVTGAWVLLKREVYERTSGIDESYFMYGEEMEWMYRARKKGYSVWYVPAGKCVHLGGASTKNLGRMFVSEVRGYVYWFKKHKSKMQQLVLPVVLLGGAFFKSIIWFILGNRNKAKANHEVVKDLLTPVSLRT